MLLEIESVDKRFGGTQALKQVSFAVSEGETLGLVGPNGAGKTTLFNAITGATIAGRRIRPDHGRILFRGHDITSMRPDQICALGIARTWQIVRPFPAMSAIENVMVGALAHVRSVSRAREIAAELCELAGLAPVAERTASELTLPSRKRLEVARALASHPTMLLLDEMGSGLTAREIEEFLSLLDVVRGRGVTLILVEHVMDVILPICSRLVVLDYGEKIAEGPPDQVLKDPRVLAAYFGT